MLGCNADVALFEGIWVWRGLAAGFWRKEVGKTPDPYEMDREMTGQRSHSHQRLSGSLR